jgi:hypothetical protein
MIDLSKLIGTRKHKGKDDDKEPDWKLLDPASIGKQVCLQGLPTCADGKVVNGDCQVFVQDNRETHILGNDTLLLKGNQIEDVEQTSTISIKQGRTLAVGVFDFTEIQGPRTFIVHGPDDEHYLIHREIDEPVEKFEHKNMCVEYGWFNAEAMASTVETKALSVAVENVKVEAKMFKQTNELIEGKIDGMTAKAEGMDVALGLLMLKGKYTLNALANWARSSPTS